MALTNAQYNTVIREYEEQQLMDRREQARRVEEVYDKLPQVRKLDLQLGEQAAACAKRMLDGDEGARARLKEKFAGLRREKEELLTGAGYPKDYMELHYRCPDCKDTGYANGRRCHCFEQARIRILYDQSNLGQVLERENFSVLTSRYYSDEVIPGLGISEKSYMEQVVRQCREFARRFPQKGGNLLFTGSTGVGKTFLANCIAKELIDRYVSVIYLPSQDLFELLSRCKFGREAEEGAEESCRHILECDMLIIDDLGTELNNAFVSSQLFYCINERINRAKGTLISTNLSMGRIRDTYSDRVASRLMSHYQMIPLYGGDIRMKKTGKMWLKLDL